MPETEVNDGIKNTVNDLWLTTVNNDGTFGFGNEANAAYLVEPCLSEYLGELGEGFAPGRPKRRPPVNS